MHILIHCKLCIDVRINAIETEVKKLAYQKACVCNTTTTTRDASNGALAFNDML
jgi:hypothetical protein